MITKKELQEHFEKEILKHTCFGSLKELQEDRTSVEVNAPRTLIACELSGVWRGMRIANVLNAEADK